MASISAQNEDFIKEKPLGASLDAIKLSFKQRDEEASSESSDDTTGFLSLREAISNLLLALAGHPVARKLRSASSRRPLDRELAALYAKASLTFTGSQMFFNSLDDICSYSNISQE